jgi:hypothetical protein
VLVDEALCVLVRHGDWLLRIWVFFLTAAAAAEVPEGLNSQFLLEFGHQLAQSRVQALQEVIVSAVTREGQRGTLALSLCFSLVLPAEQKVTLFLSLEVETVHSEQTVESVQEH